MREADEDMRAETGGTALERALQTDHAAAHHGEYKSEHHRHKIHFTQIWNYSVH